MVGVLKSIHERRREIDAYLALCEAEGELEPGDCETLAAMRLKRRKPEDALAWVDRGLVLEKKDRWQDPAALVERTSRKALMRLSHYTTEPAAAKLEKTHPLLAAKLQVALGLRIVEAKKSRYYPAALGHLETARRILLREDRVTDWNRVVAEIRERHHRKSGFMPRFERVVSGHASRPEPSFLDRALARRGRGTVRGSKETQP